MLRNAATGSLGSRSLASGLALGLLGCLLAACAPILNDTQPPDDDPPVAPDAVDELAPVGRVVGFVYTDAEGGVALRPRPSTEPGLTPAPGAALLLDTGGYARTNEGGLLAMGHVPVGQRTARIWLGPDMGMAPSAATSFEVRWRQTTCLGSSEGGSGGRGAAVGWAYESPEGTLLSPCPRFGLRPRVGTRVSLGGAECETNEVGYYLLPSVRDGTHMLRVGGDAMGEVIVAPGQTACGVDAAPDSWAAAAGHAGLAYDAPMPYVSVEPTIQTVMALPGALLSLDTGQQALADERGEYTLYGVEPGLRTLTIAAPGYGGAALVLITLPGAVTRGSEAPAGSIGRIDLSGAEGVGFVEVGEVLPLRKLAFSPSGERWEGFSSFEWSVSDTSRATVDRHGRVTGRAMGPVTVRATAGGAEGSVNLLVEPKGFQDAVTVEIVLDGPATLSEGSTRTALAQVRDAGGRVLPGYPVEFRCEDRSVAEVTSKGIVAGLREGSTVLVAEALRTGGLSARAPLTVIPADDRLRVEPLELRFEGAGQGLLAITDITAGAEGMMDWTAAATEPWLIASPPHGVGDGEVTVTAAPGDLPPGVYTTLIEVDAGAHGRRVVFVEMSIQRIDVIIE